MCKGDQVDLCCSQEQSRVAECLRAQVMGSERPSGFNGEGKGFLGENSSFFFFNSPFSPLSLLVTCLHLSSVGGEQRGGQAQTSGKFILDSGGLPSLAHLGFSPAPLQNVSTSSSERPRPSLGVSLQKEAF